MVTMCSQRLNEFELHARAILGLPVDVRMTQPGASAVIYGGIESETLRFCHLEAALQIPNSDLRLFGKPASFARRRMGVALASADNVIDARTNAQKVADFIETKGD
jgi:phosphoribosylglycinamide formyltransferase 2